MAVGTPPAENVTLDSPMGDSASSVQAAKRRRFEETSRRMQELVGSGKIRFDPDATEDGTSDPPRDFEPKDNSKTVTRLRDEYLRRKCDAS